AHHANAAQILWVVSRPVHPPAERVRLRHTIEDEQCPARSVTAERAERHTLTGGMAAGRIRPAKQLHAGHVLQELVERVRRRLFDLAAVDTLSCINPLR